MDDGKLTSIGINVGLVVAGFFGGLLTVGKSSARNVKTTLTSVLAGVAAANYLTPLVVDFLKLTNPNMGYSIGFVFGFLGLRGVEVVAAKLTTSLEEKKK